MARFQILSLAGGGIRGSFITAYLSRLEAKLGRPIAESFDLIAGTSTGGIIAAGLAAGIPAREIQEFYENYGARIFTPRPKYRAGGLMRFVFPVANWAFRRRTGSGLESAFRARYCSHALEEAFGIGFAGRTMGSVDFTRLIIPAINLTRGRPHVFRSLHLPKGVHDQHIKISDVLIATTAAPTYFPHRQIGDHAFADGGLWAADPSLLAIAEAVRVRQLGCAPEDEACPRYDTSDIHLLSIGTGRTEFAWTPPADAGLLYWAPRIADVMTTAQVEGIHLPIKFLLGNRYRHINFPMTENWDLADTGNMPALFRQGIEVADGTYATIHDAFFQHQRERFTPYANTDQEIVDV